MKRYLITAVSLLFISMIVITSAFWGMPESGSMSAVRRDGDIILSVENRIVANYVYEISGSEITGCYSVPVLYDGGTTELLSVCLDGENLYILRDVPDKSVWQILSPDETGGLEAISDYAYGTDDALLDFSVSQGAGAIVVRDSSGNTRVWSCDDVKAGDWSLIKVYEAPGAGSVEQARYLDGTLYTRLSGGEMLAVTNSGAATLSGSGTDMFATPEIYGLRVPLAVRLKCKAPLYMIALIILAVIFIPLIIAESIRRRSESIAVRSAALIIALFTITSILLTGYFVLYAVLKYSAAVLTGPFDFIVVPLVGCVIVSSILFSAALKRESRAFSSLTGQMSRIADGDYSVADVPDRVDEIGGMARSMQEMCVALSIRDYEVNNTMLSYHRFVPNGLEELLNRASVMEVSLGDSRSISGNMAIITVCNRRTIRLLLSDDDYVSFVNRSSSLMDGSIRTYGGLLLSSGYDMAGNRVYFRGENNNGVRAALDLLGAVAESGKANSVGPEFFILLHNTEFLYGIAGSPDNLFPYISSSELEFLGSYSDQFRAAGVHIVMTEPFLKQLEGNYTTRYIGFVSSSGFQLSFKLYEVLDAYTDLERNLRVSYDPRLQEAITMFYKSDYYLARNLFSNILRVCPSDGIARWYLFACEHFFNAAENEEPNFQLFGFDFD